MFARNLTETSSRLVIEVTAVILILFGSGAVGMTDQNSGSWLNDWNNDNSIGSEELFLAGSGNELDDQQKILFVSDRLGDEDIWIMNPDGSSQEQLVSWAGSNEKCPAISPDGSKIAFVSNRDADFELFIYDFTTNSASKVPTGLGWHWKPNWSPDGNTIVMSGATSYTLCGAEIYTVSPDGSNLVRWTNNGVPDESPSYSPDGNTIAFHRIEQCFLTYSSDIYKLDVNSGSIDECTVTGSGGEKDINYSPVYFPSGDSLLWEGGDRTTSDHQIWTAHSDCGNQRVFYGLSDRLEGGIGFAPNGSGIVFHGRYGYQAPNQIYIYDFGTGLEEQLTSEGSNTQPVWGYVSVGQDLADWPMAACDPQHTGSTTDELSLDCLNTVASLCVTSDLSSFLSGPVMQDGIAYVSGVGNCMYAWDVETGTVLWEFCDPERRLRASVDGDYIYVSADEQSATGGRLYKLDAQTGAEISWVSVPGEPEPPVVANGTVYIGYAHYWSGPYGLIALDSDDLSTIWNHTNATGYGYHPPAVSDDGQNLYASDGGGRLQCFDALTGSVQWTYTSGHAWGVNMPTIVGSTVYFVAGCGNISAYAVNAETGDLLWSEFLSGSGDPAQTISYFDNVLYVTADGTLYALDCADNGNVLWSFTADDGCWAPSVAGGVVYVATSGNGTLYALDGLTGNQLWSHVTGFVRPQFAGPAISDGHILISFTDNNNLWMTYNFGCSDGPVTADADMTPDPIYVYWEYAVDPMVDTVYVGNFSDGHSASDVDPSSVMLNGTIAPIEWNVIPSAAGFADDVLEICFPMPDFISFYGPMIDTTTQIYEVSGSFGDGITFAAVDSFTMIGKIPGDMNYDMKVNLVDISLLTGYIFRGGRAPVPLEAGDANQSGETDIDDVVGLIAYIYLGTPLPSEQQIGEELLAKMNAGKVFVEIDQNTSKFSNSSIVSINSNAEIQAVQLAIRGDNPQDVRIKSLVDGMQLFSGVVGGELRVGLIDLNGDEVLPTGESEILEIEMPTAGTYDLTDVIMVGYGGGKLDVEYKSALTAGTLPEQYSLHQNYPNPFNPTTIISFSMKKAGDYQLTVFNVLGQVVDIIEGTALSPSEVKVEWDGSGKASGVYFYRLDTDNFSDTKKMMLMK